LPEILHEQTGLKIKRNDHNGFVVCSLHFTADPAKRDEWWAREAAAGMPPSEFEREYNLKYIVASGERVFPEFTDFNARIVVPQLDGERDSEGIAAPCLYAIWEHYATTTSLQDLAAALQSCPYWPRIKWIGADRHLQSRDQIDQTGPHSKLDQLITAGIGGKMIMAPSNESDWIALMRDYWYDLEHRPARFRIFSNCPNMIREFEGAVFDDMTEGIQVKHNLKETMRDKNNHALDDCKYFMLLGPRPSGPLAQARQQAKHTAEVWRRHML
jgi:hypothetical protein